MKSILFIGATLMAGACVYGFVDYKSTNRKKEFRSLYSKEKATPKPLPAPEQVADIKTTEKVNEKPIPAEVAGKSTTVQGEEKKTVDTKKTARKKKKVARDKKITFKKYSRAALVEEEVIVPEKQ